MYDFALGEAGPDHCCTTVLHHTCNTPEDS
jgi:hypothetical protein